MSNLPPGVTEGMIPGNRPWDLAIEKLFDELDGMIVTFLDDSAIVDKADIPQVLRDLLTGYERELLERDLLDNGRPHGISPTMGECDCDECQRYDYLFNQQGTQYGRELLERKLVNRCRFCGEIPEDCECSKGRGSREPLTDG